MLQQTQVKTVIPYFENFTKIKTLKMSKSSEQKFLKLWEGLGIIERQKSSSNFKILVNKYNSKLPRTTKEIKDLPGVGDYTANALIGLVHNLPTIAVDGNVREYFQGYLTKKKTN